MIDILISLLMLIVGITILIPALINMLVAVLLIATHKRNKIHNI